LREALIAYRAGQPALHSCSLPNLKTSPDLPPERIRQPLFFREGNSCEVFCHRYAPFISQTYILACLGRRSRATARTLAPLEHGMFLVGCLYNFCTPHDSLRPPLYVGRYGRQRWVQRTPALAAGLTDHIWSVEELLTFKVPPPPFVPPKRRGRPPKPALLEAAA
jgi:hypothetical protein